MVNNWGKGAVNNSIGYGQAHNNQIGFGSFISYAGVTDIQGFRDRVIAEGGIIEV